MNNIFAGRNVLVTGHTGFKGSWLSLWLEKLGANVVGYAMPPKTERDNFVQTHLADRIISVMGDTRDYAALFEVFRAYKPEIVFHLAAQPLVRLSYAQPKLTFDTNIGGTVNVLECCRCTDSVKVIIDITSDKCYKNNEWVWGYRENDPLGGDDPYSASKACSELVAAAYRNSFFKDGHKSLSTVRAGNVFGGGDWSADRLLPDCFRALAANKPIAIRSPESTRPWQYVLEPLHGYMTLAAQMWESGNMFAGAWNFGPRPSSVVSVRVLVSLLMRLWGTGAVEFAPYKLEPRHEAQLLALDISKAEHILDWHPALTLEQAMKYTVDWHKNTNPDYAFCLAQINDYCEVRNRGNR